MDLDVKILVEKVRKNTDWDTPLAKGQGRGFAAGKMLGSFIAEVVTVEVLEKNKVNILRVDEVVDCGIVVNPSGALAQVNAVIAGGRGGSPKPRGGKSFLINSTCISGTSPMRI